VFVNVVVALGTEPVLAARSDGPPCVSKEASWVMIAGRVLLDRPVGPSSADDVLVPQSVERTPSATDCLVVVAGVTVGGSAPESATAEAWWVGGGAEGSESVAAGGASLGEYAFGTDSCIVGFPLLELQVNAWPLCDAV
jgi:hypothetical protein